MKKGISLVALVITIIVLIILTVTAVLNIGGENIIIRKAKSSTENYTQLEAQEIIIARLMEYKAAMALSSNTVGTLSDMVQYFEEKGVDISVVTLSDLIGETQWTFNTQYTIIPCIIERAPEDISDTSLETNIYDKNNLFLKLKGNNYLFAVDSQSFEIIGEVKEIENSTVIKDAIKEIEMLEEIIFKIKKEGLEINLETLQQNNKYSNFVTIDYIDEMREVEEMMKFNDGEYYQLLKLGINGGGQGIQSRIKRAVIGVAKAVFNNSGRVYIIRANGIIESDDLGQNIESAIRNDDMSGEMDQEEGSIRD